MLTDAKESNFINAVEINDFLAYCRGRDIDFSQLTEEESEEIMMAIQLNKDKKSRKELVLSKHVTKEGKPRAISQQSDGKWTTVDPANPSGKNRIRSKTYDGLIDKLYDYYKDSPKDYSIGTWFEIGLKKIQRDDAVTDATITRHRKTAKSYFTEDFLKKDVRYITARELKEFFLEMVMEHHPRQTGFTQFKGSVNVIFKAAADFEEGCRDDNPVTAINNKPFFLHCVTDKQIKQNACNISLDGSEYEDYEEDDFVTAFSPDQVQKVIAKCRERIVQYGDTKRYEVIRNSYMFMFAAYTGVRISEIGAITKADIRKKYIHIHRMIRLNEGKHGSERYTLLDFTKNERGISRGGRRVPLYCEELEQLLVDALSLQEKFGITSEFLFCDREGGHTTIESYREALIDLCKSLGFTLTNNHAFRKALNAKLEREYGMNPAERSTFLGHSVLTNLKFYSKIDNSFVDKFYNGKGLI